MASVLLACVWLGAPSDIAEIPARYGDVAHTYELTKLADGVYAFLTPDSKTPFVSSNSLVVIGTDAVLVVDSGHVPALTRRMIADIRRLTSAPVKYLVNTHWHFDHVVGNGEYAAAFPGLTIISCPSTQAQMNAQVPGYPAQIAQQVGAGVTAIRQMLASGTRRDGTPLSADDRAFYEAEVHDFEIAAPAVQEMKYAPPTLTVDDAISIDLGKRSVRVLFLGRGNTAGDAVTFVPDAKVVAAGDLLVAPVPYATASFMFEWPETMRRLKALGAETILPGHGPVLRDWRYADEVVELLRAVTGQVEKNVAEGLTLEDTRKRVDVAKYREALAGNDPFQRRIFDTFFLPGAIERAYAEARFRNEK